MDDYNKVYDNGPVDYLDTGHYDEFGQMIYNLEYGDDGFDIDPRDRNNDGKPDTWIITAKDIPVKLSVRRFDSYNMGKNQRV